MTELELPHRFEPGKDPAAPTLLLLHGTGGDENDLLPLGRQLGARGALLSPRGQVLEGGMNRWFRRLAEGVFDVEDVAGRAGQLARFVTAAAREYGFAPDRVVAVGFSNGANIAAAVLLLHPSVLRGAVLFSSMLPLEPPSRPDLPHAAVYMAQGRVDPMAPPEQAERLAQVLSDAGASVTLDWHDSGHRVGPAQLGPATTWFTKFVSATAGREHGLP